jgi:hypothetical protein
MKKKNKNIRLRPGVISPPVLTLSPHYLLFSKFTGTFNKLLWSVVMGSQHLFT